MAFFGLHSPIIDVIDGPANFKIRILTTPYGMAVNPNLNRKRAFFITATALFLGILQAANLVESHPKVAADLRAKLETWAAELPKDYIKEAK